MLRNAGRENTGIIVIHQAVFFAMYAGCLTYL